MTDKPESETTAGLSAVPELPVVAYRRYSTFTGWYYWGDDHAEPGSPNAEDLTPHAPAQATIDAQAAEIERLKGELASLIPAGGLAEEARDAARYQWFRNRVFGVRDRHGIEEFGMPAVTPCVASIMKGSVAQHFDAAIDAAMAASTPPQEAK